MISQNTINLLVNYFEARLGSDLSPSIYINVNNPRGFIEKQLINELHSSFLEYSKAHDGDLYWVLPVNETYELIIEKLYDISDNILLISLSPSSVIHDINTELFSDLSELKIHLKECLNANSVSIKVTY